MGEPIIRLDGVWKRFRLGEWHASLGDRLAAAAARWTGRGPTADAASFWALQDVSLAVEAGEAVGVIGPNGSGKSTALRLIAGILRPERGAIQVRGRLAALIEVGAGFHGDLTGRENVYLNGAILGMRRAEIHRKLEAIVAFAGLERFLDTPVKRYSSGMYARLGFSIAAHVEPKVLLVDEVLAVGDAAFRLRCLERMKELVRGGTGLVFVTHNLEQVQPICRRTVVLDGGRVRFVGPSSEAVSHYLAALSQGRTSRPTDLPADAAAIGSTVTLAGVRIGPAAGAATGRSHGTRGPAMELRLRCHRPPVPVIIECNLRGIGYENLLSLNSGRDGRPLSLDHEDNIVALKLADIPLAPGQYFWNVRVWDAKNGQTLLDTPFRFPFVLAGGPVTGGLVQVEHSWSCAASELRRADMEPAALSESIRDGSPLACTDYVYQPGR